MSAALAITPAPAPWATVAAVVARYGFTSSRMFLRWCRRHGVEVRGEGKTLFVSPAAVERTISELPSRGRRHGPAAEPTATPAAVRLANAMTGGRS